MTSSIISSTSNNNKTYPYIGKAGDVVVLFTGRNTGMVLIPSTNNNLCPIGHYSTTWGEEHYTNQQNITINFKL